jgi:4-azaleucine resistance transporter AzlC
MSKETSSVQFTLSGAIEGYRKCIPIALGVFAYGLVFGILAKQAGLNVIEAVLMSATVLAGSAQLIAMRIWDSPVPVVTIVVTTLIVNLRYLLMGASLRPWFSELTPSKAYGSAFFMADENWALTIDEYKSGNVKGAFLLGSGLAVWSFWIVATIIGVTAGSAIDDPSKWGLDFAFTAVFITLLVSMWEGKHDLLPFGVAGIVAIITMWLVGGQWHLLTGGFAGSIVGMIQYED